MEVEEIDEDEPEVLEVDVPAAAADPADDDAEVLEVDVPAGTSQMEVEGLDDVDVPVAASDDGAGAQAAQLLCARCAEAVPTPQNVHAVQPPLAEACGAPARQSA